MAKVFTVPDNLASKLQAQASAKPTSLDDPVAGLLTRAECALKAIDLANDVAEGRGWTP